MATVANGSNPAERANTPNEAPNSQTAGRSVGDGARAREIRPAPKSGGGCPRDAAGRLTWLTEARASSQAR